MTDRTIETARHVLRPIHLGELDALHALWTHPEVRRWLFDDTSISRDGARDPVERSEAVAGRGLGHWSVRSREDGTLLGSAALLPLDPDDVELLYLLHPDHRGQGHATEAGAALLERAFGVAGLDRVVAQADRPNTASFEVMKRLGMVFERELEGANGPLVEYAIRRAND